MAKEYPPHMHTAEHILNQTMVRMFGSGRSFSAHIEKKKSKCDYHFDRNLTPDEIVELESRVNSVIAADMQVTQAFMPRDEANRLFDLSRLPDTAGNLLRVIRIGDYDACPCRGQHVPQTGHIGRFTIISTSYDNGVLRVRFKAEATGGDTGTE